MNNVKGKCLMLRFLLKFYGYGYTARFVVQVQHLCITLKLIVNIYVYEFTLIFKFICFVKIYDYFISLIFIVNFNVMNEELF
jgi:hypothetical protein